MNKLFKFLLFLMIPLLSVLVIGCNNDDDDTPPQPATPSITTVTPAEGLPGTSVTITGTNLDDASQVTFGGTAATVTANTATSITTSVPATAGSGSQPISVTTPGGTATHAFTVLEESAPAPTITSFDPEEGVVGDEITITGTNFNSDDILSVWIGDVEITEYTVVDENTITFTVPENAETNTVTINLLQGDPVVSGSEFTVTADAAAEARVYSNVVIHAQGARMDEEIHTILNLETGTTHHYTEPVEDEELARTVDFLLVDTNGENNWAIFSPNPEGDAVWLENNFYKEVAWPHTNTTILRVLEDADEEFFNDATAEIIEGLPIGENDEDNSGRINGLEIGNVILFQSDSGRKGLIYFKEVDQDTVEDYKDDIFTVDVKVVDPVEEGGE